MDTYDPLCVHECVCSVCIHNPRSVLAPGLHHMVLIIDNNY